MSEEPESTRPPSKVVRDPIEIRQTGENPPPPVDKVKPPPPPPPPPPAKKD